MEEIFDSSVRAKGDFAGVFEFDGETAYFYLYATGGGVEEPKIWDSVHVFSGQPDFAESDISVRWDSREEKVGLFIRGILWAVFDCVRQSKCGGDYVPGRKPSLPAEAIAEF